jgi:hypothetical protein
MPHPAPATRIAHKTRAGKRLKARKAKHEPASAIDNQLASNSGPALQKASVTPAITINPAAKPSMPSVRLTALQVPTKR